jgi:hypothetical protein
VVDRAVLSLEAVKEARHEIWGAAVPLNGIVMEADCLINALSLVKEIDSFQTAEIGRKAQGIMELSPLLAASMMVMGAESRHQVEPRILQPHDHEYSHLNAMLWKLQDAREALERLMTAAYVGVQGNSRDGFRVSRHLLVDTNSRVRGVFGVDTMIFIELQDKLREQTGRWSFISKQARRPCC